MTKQLTQSVSKKRPNNRLTIAQDPEIVSEEVLEAMGISRPAYEEIQSIVGRLPTVEELSTLLAMWKTQGGGQGLLSWLRGQPHSTERHDYLESDLEPHSKEFQEPRIKDCVDIARKLYGANGSQAVMLAENENAVANSQFSRGDAIYMVGDVSGLFANSDYGRQYLHLVDNPIDLPDEQEAKDYIALILDSLQQADAIASYCEIGRGGLFGTLLRCTAHDTGSASKAACVPHRVGFDILSYREVRLDAFLFGEQGARFIAAMQEPQEDFFLQKLVEARLNCCFLGHATKGRILVDGMDFGDRKEYRQYFQ